MKNKIILAPSILSADFSNLWEDIKKVESEADWLHIDVMDGHFVPNITVGPALVKALRRRTKLPLDVHLMIESPEKFIPAFAEAGADWITIHTEATPHVHRTLELIHHHGKKAGLSLNPATPLSHLDHVVQSLDLVLLMTVNPGFEGQSFIQSVVPKIREASRRLPSSVLIEVDGGISGKTAAAVAAAGARVLVAGSAIFHQKDPAKAAREIRKAAEAALTS